MNELKPEVEERLLNEFVLKSEFGRQEESTTPEITSRNLRWLRLACLQGKWNPFEEIKWYASHALSGCSSNANKNGA